MSEIAKPHYLKKSIRIFKFYTIATLILILIIMLLPPSRKNYPILVSALTLLLLVIALIFPPMGLYYSWKSYQAKEEPRKKRTMFFMGASVFLYFDNIICYGHN
ncbi:hypothetical protein [Sphingobacterium sp. 2149]|uniref:hypothetical protein n=1 Tax=Sphingobacterium sp. 2149 TaxID=2817763 RepID=UPI00285C1916|nr:hypothetical protein [Sphingobacterium sp. 2149]MDR6734813.1 putative ABC-type exoprotein transport system permease subunit [Sphingobacterium sp. 2149]